MGASWGHPWNVRIKQETRAGQLRGEIAHDGHGSGLLVPEADVRALPRRESRHGMRVDRLNKWVQGRSLPRAASVYDDLAKVIGTTKSGRWVATCSVEDFAGELIARTGADLSGFAAPGKPEPRGPSHPVGLFGGVAALGGAFAAYSPAWSPHYRGHLVRGALRLTASRADALTAVYTETMVDRTVRLIGDVLITGRTLHIPLREEDGGLPLFVTLQLPGPPASVMCGVMSGTAFVAAESLPCSSRVMFVRVPDDARLDATNRYLDAAPGAVANDLSELGLAARDLAELDAMARAFLGTAPDQVTAQDQTAFASILDRRYLPAPAETPRFLRAV